MEFLEQEHISPALLDGVRAYRAQYPAEPALQGRIPQPRYHYYGKEVWEAAIAALLCGENLLLAGSKATGKNVLAENLAQAFGRPAWDVSFHVSMDAAGLIGMDTFENGQVTFRPGPVYLCAKHGGFGVLDEINMAKNEALAVLHATLDFRRAIDVPGYDRVTVDPAARFIGTMNYGYAGTLLSFRCRPSRRTVWTVCSARSSPRWRKSTADSSCSSFSTCKRSAGARRSPPRRSTCAGFWTRCV